MHIKALLAASFDFMCNTTPATPKAYQCFGKDPIQTGCVHAMGDPTVFCCAK